MPQTLQLPLTQATLTSSRNQKRIAEVLPLLQDGLDSGRIYNTDFKLAKDLLSRLMADMAEIMVRDVIFARDAQGNHPPLLNDIHAQLITPGAHTWGGFRKRLERLEKSHPDHPATPVLRALHDEFAPLANAVNDLKESLVMGRKPASSPATRAEEAEPRHEPDKKTCPCCQRGIALAGATMAHHGYKRPGMGVQTASCPGIKYRPLEVSSEGLRDLVDHYRERASFIQEALSDPAGHPANLLVRVQSKGAWANGARERIGRDDPRWAMAYSAWAKEMENEAAAIAFSLPRLEQQLLAWHPVEDEQGCKLDDSEITQSPHMLEHQQYLQACLQEQDDETQSVAPERQKG